MNIFREIIRSRIKKITHHQSLIEKVAWFVACEKVAGDYLEFGTYKGSSFIASYNALQRAFRRRTGFSTGTNLESKDNEERGQIWSEMKFIGFDSFEGLPPLTKEDQGTEDFKKGMYSCTEDEFRHNLMNKRVMLDKVITVKGFFEETCTSEILSRYNINKASIVFIDCDLYSSTKTVLNFVSNILQDGTVIIFDDWYSYKGSRFRGEQKAFFEWINTPNISQSYYFTEYQKEDWKRNSFIVSTKF